MLSTHSLYGFLRDGLLCRDTINRQGVEHEQARIGAAYTLGQAAKGGNTDALAALQVRPAGFFAVEN